MMAAEKEWIYLNVKEYLTLFELCLNTPYSNFRRQLYQ